MSTIEPPDADDEFQRLMDGLDLTIPTNVESVTMLDEVELSRRFNDCKQQLLRRGEMISPKTDEGRELHSLRAAYIVEMRRRGMS